MGIISELGQVIASVSASSVVHHVVAAILPNDTKRITKIGLVLGGTIIGSLIGDAAANHVKGVINSFKTEEAPSVEV